MRWLISLGTAVLLSIGWCRAEVGTSPPTAALESTVEARAEALVAAARAHEEALRRVRANVTIQRFMDRSVDHWMGEGDITRRRSEAKQPTDRDMAVARFAADGPQYRIEFQVLMWSGGFPGWFGYRLSEATRPWDDTADLFLRIACDGEYVQHVSGSRRGPEYARRPANGRFVQLYRGQCDRWFGVRQSPFVGSYPAPQRRRLLSITDEALEGEPARLVREATWRDDGPPPDGFAEVRQWFGTRKGYALLRREVLHFPSERKSAPVPPVAGIPGPSSGPFGGDRDVCEWSDLVESNGVWVPRRFVSSDYVYLPAADGKPAQAFLTRTSRTTLSDIVVGEPVSFDLLANPIPLGARRGLSFGEVPLADLQAQSAVIEAPWLALAHFRVEPLPKPDPRYMVPPTPEQLAALRKEAEL